MPPKATPTDGTVRIVKRIGIANLVIWLAILTFVSGEILHESAKSPLQHACVICKRAATTSLVYSHPEASPTTYYFCARHVGVAPKDDSDIGHPMFQAVVMIFMFNVCSIIGFTKRSVPISLMGLVSSLSGIVVVALWVTHDLA